MHVLLLTLLAACGGDPAPYTPPEPRPEGWFDPGIDRTDAAPVVQLYRLPGRYTLPETSVPPDHDPAKRLEVAVAPEARKKGATRFKGKLPFDLGHEGRRNAPPGMRVFLPDGRELPHGPGRQRWNLRGNDISVGVDVNPGRVFVSYEGVVDDVDRKQFGRAGIPAVDFVRYAITLDDHTRDGMLLPAPATAEWDVTIPASGATFETWLAIQPPALRFDRSDGATTILEVIDGDQTVEVGRHALNGPSNDYVRWSLDLSRFGGKQVTVRLRTDPGATPWFDYVFLGSPTISGDPSGDVRRIVVIGLDTTRPDHISWYGYDRETTPEFDRVLDQSAVFTRAWCPAPRTRPSFRTATTGRYPLKAVGAKNIGEVFQEEGFATAAFVSNIHLQPRFDFHEGFDSWKFESRSDAASQVNHALQWLADQRDRDSYMFLHIMDPHIFYNAPGAFREKFVTDPDPALPKTFNRWQVYQMEKRGELTEQRKAHIEALYDGEMAYMSTQLARFFDGLDAMGGRTLVIIHSDHGEEFWEHGGFEHNHTLYDETTRAVMVVRPGRGMASPIKVDTPVTLADIGPTLYDFAGIESPPPTDGRSLRPLVEGNPGEGWDRPIGVAFLRYGAEQWAVVWNDHKYILHTGSGREELYDLEADPGEQKDLSASADLSVYRQKLAEAHEMPVGLGWRIFVDLQEGAGEAWMFTLPRKPELAGVLDPERTVDAPSNQSWGEPPTRRPEEIGEAALEGATLTWKPGHKPMDGQLFVLWGEALDPAGLVVKRGDEEVVMRGQPDGSIVWRQGRNSVRVVQSTVLAPLPGEADLMRMLRDGGGDASDEQIAWLRAMGYVGGGEEDEGDGEHADDGHGH